MQNKTKVLFLLDFAREHWAVISTLVVGLSMGISVFYAENFFGKFGVRYLHFANFSDLIKLLFLSKTFFLSLFLFSSVFVFTSLASSQKDEQSTQLSQPKRFFLVLLSIVLVPILFFVLIAPFTSPSLDASSIKNGQAAFYNISYNGGKTIAKCTNIIGVSSNNYLVWDFQNKKTIIIPKAQIIDLQLILEKYESKSVLQDVDGNIEDLLDRKKQLADVCKHV